MKRIAMIAMMQRDPGLGWPGCCASDVGADRAMG